MFGRISLVGLLALTSCASFGMREENDFFTLFNEDRYYSQGVEFTYGGKDYDYSLGNEIYTPNDKWATELIKEDRPYVGYSYFGVSNKPDSGSSTIHSLQVGAVGPAAGGEHVQNNFHDLIGDAHFHGWDNQIHNEPILNYSNDSVLYGDRECTSISAITQVGNYDTSFTLRPERRIGFRLFDDYSLTLFAAAEGQAKAYDITLDGNTFRSSHSVEKKPLVGALIGGICLKRNSLFFGYIYRRSTKEFEGQDYGHSYGSVRLGYGRCE